MSEIEINGITLFYEIYQDIDYDFNYTETRFYKSKTKIVSKRKYWIFGEKYKVEVKRDDRDFDFKLPFSIKNPKYTKDRIKKIIIREMSRRDEINFGQII